MGLHKILLTDEVLEENILDEAATSIALDQHHVVRAPGVDVAVSDVADIGIRAKRAHTTSTTPVAVDALNEDVLRWALLLIVSLMLPAGALIMVIP